MASSAGRVAGGGLLLAALTIVALGILVLMELDRESRLQLEVIAQIEAAEQADGLREQLRALGHAARLAAVAAGGESAETVESLAAQVEATLVALASAPGVDKRYAAFGPIAQDARLAILNARSVDEQRRRGGAAAAEAAAREAERVALQASAALDRSVERDAARLNRRVVARVRAGESLRRYVAWVLGGSLVLLTALFVLYRGARRREGAALSRIEQLAHFDAVTGLPNRSLLLDRLEQEVARAHRSERPFALACFDLDGFKAVNDTWGHAAGDRALRMVAQRAREAVRASDTVGRVGGDEFLALLPETSLDGALHVAEKLRDALESPYVMGSAEARMSASIGIALFPAHGSDAEALQRAADAALYEAKREGKNRVCVASRAPRRRAPARSASEVPASTRRPPSCRSRKAARRWASSRHGGGRRPRTP